MNTAREPSIRTRRGTRRAGAGRIAPAALTLLLSIGLGGPALAAEPAGSISGTLVNDQGRALAGIGVQAYGSAADYYSGSPVAGTVTDPAGAFELAGLAPGSYVVRFNDHAGVHDPGYVQTFFAGPGGADPVDVAGGQSVDVSLDLPATQVTGIVRDAASGSGIGGVPVQAYPWGAGTGPGDAPAARAFSGRTGIYTLAGLPDGSYLVQFNDLLQSSRNPAYYQQFYDGIPYWSQSVDFTPVTVAAGEVATGIDARLTPLILTTTTLTSSANPARAGQPITYTATVSPAPAGGMMVFKDNGELIPGCGFTAFPLDTATCTLSYPTAGRHTVQAAWTGDAVYGPSQATDLVQVVLPNPPTSKQQCMHGGWRSFTDPAFRNQGDCISYVQHHH